MGCDKDKGVGKRRFGMSSMGISKKAIIFTIDAVLAVLAAMALISGSYYYLSQTQNIQWTNADKSQIAMNSLAVLEMSNSLQGAAATMSAAELDNYLNNILPAQLCANIMIFTETGAQLLTTIKSGCAVPEYKAVVIRDFYFRGFLYYAQMGVWYG